MNIEKEWLTMKGKLTSLELYEKLISRLNKWYMKHGNELPVLDLSKVEWIDALCLPNLLVIATIIKSYHKKPLQLILPHNMQIVNFLKTSEFLSTGTLDYLQLFKYDDEKVSRASFLVNKENRDEHKIYHYNPNLNYYIIDNEKNQMLYRTLMYEHIRYVIVLRNYKTIIEDKNVLRENEVDVLLDIISEIICNSVLYSKSVSYSFMQTDKYKSCFAISDAGIGFKNSLLNKKNFKYTIQNKYKKCFNNPKFQDLLIILEVLNYSMDQNRKNLWSLKSLIVNSGGTLRIHNNSTQVVFTANKCSGCNKTAEGCLICLKESYDNGLSNLRIFDGRLRGVHIEVELRNGVKR